MFRREAFLRNTQTGVVHRHIAGVTELMFGGLCHERYQNGSSARRTEFRHGRRARPADHKVAFRIGLGHILDKGNNLSFNPGIGIAFFDFFHRARTALMKYLRTVFRVKKRKRLRHRLI